VAELEALLALQTADSDLDAKRARLDEIKASLGASAGLSAARAAVEAADRELKAHEATQRQLEWQVDDLSDKIRELDARLYSGRIGNPKELASLQTEIQHMRADLGALEERALEAIDATDQQRAEVERLRRELAEVEARWRDEQAAMKNEQAELIAAVAQILDRRATIAREVGAATLAKYEELRKSRRGLAVARVDRNTCLGCRTTLPTSQVQTARHGDLAFCSSCGRILYVAR
jgi:predicted  nucleic acid-binding Zn-ribbon protein